MKKMKKNYLNILVSLLLLISFSGCSLDENNPSGVTLDKSATTVDGYNKLINTCYFDLQRYYYGRTLLNVTEGGTDLWTSRENSNANSNYMKYGMGSTIPATMAVNWWDGGYDGINSANTCIDRIDKVIGFASDADKNTKVAEAHFLRALYYFHLVEQFGACIMTVHETTEAITLATKTDPLVIYKEVIIPDLEFAAKYLPRTVTSDNLGRPTQKAALGLLAKTCLQTKEYGTTEYLEEALKTANLLIDDVNANGVTYDVKLYSNYSDNFHVDIQSNDEALYLVAYSQNYGSTNVYDHNNDYQKFYCTPGTFGAISTSSDEKRKVGRWSGNGVFMPSRYLLDLFTMPDGSIDPRYAQSFQTLWTANQAYTWTDDALKQFDKTTDVSTSTSLAVDDIAIKFCKPGETNYATELADKQKTKYLWIDINDVYGEKSVNMKYTRVNRSAGVVDNPFLYFYPSLKKFNNGFQYISTTTKYTSDASAIVMRTGEVYLIAAEAEFYLKGATTTAANYINVLRTRAYGVGLGQITSGDISLQFILDERARELCGEYTRWYDLKRTGKLNKAYLNDKNPDVGQYFIDGVHGLRPIPQTQIDAISNPVGFQNPGY